MQILIIHFHIRPILDFLLFVGGQVMLRFIAYSILLLLGFWCGFNFHRLLSIEETFRNGCRYYHKNYSNASDNPDQLGRLVFAVLELGTLVKLPLLVISFRHRCKKQQKELKSLSHHF